MGKKFLCGNVWLSKKSKVLSPQARGTGAGYDRDGKRRQAGRRWWSCEPATLGFSPSESFLNTYLRIHQIFGWLNALVRNKMGLRHSSDEIVPPSGCSLGHSSHERLKNGRRSKKWWWSVAVSTELISVVWDGEKFENILPSPISCANMDVGSTFCDRVT